MDALLSIIVPVFNTEQYLPRCLDSILSQSFTDFELLLIDDGSTDSSGAICDAYAEMDGRVRAFHKVNGGVSSARNVGLKEAKGEWVCFVDSDDEFLPDGLQVLVNGVSEEVDMVMAGYEMCDENEKLTYLVEVRTERIISDERAAKEMFSPSDYWYEGYIWGKMFRQSIVESSNLLFAEDIYFNEDRLFLVEFVYAMKRNVYYTTVPVYKYYERSGSAMVSLKQGFNYKFITDIEAQIRMREIIRSRFENEELFGLADYEIYKSFRRIVGMMKEYDHKDFKLKSRLYIHLVNSIGIKTFLKFEVQRDKRRVLKLIKKIKS